MKDLDGTLAGEPFHQGNVMLRDLGHRADTDSFLFAKLRAGVRDRGEDEHARVGLLPTTEPLAYGPTRNPWNTDRSPGGSSGGSAAAVASGMVPMGHGVTAAARSASPSARAGCSASSRHAGGSRSAPARERRGAAWSRVTC